MLTYEQYLRQSVVPKEVIDRFLDPDQPSWARFDPEVGYTLGNFMPRDGIDGCGTISTAQSDGARTQHMYPDRPCRLNTYGNSFTQCHQVSDGETWQEYLAAHLGEPIRNFGMGGFGVYQAYCRLRRIEPTELGARYIILYIWGDDSCRSVMRCRRIVTYPWWNDHGGTAFHGNFWANLELDLNTRQFVEKPNLLSTPASLSKMTDPDFMVEALHDDLMVQLYCVGKVETSSLDTDRLRALAEALEVEGLHGATPEQQVVSAKILRYAYGFAATRHILDASTRFCRENGKELMIALLCPQATRQLLRGEPRYDQTTADHVTARGFRTFDMNLVHVRDFKSFNLSVEDYMKRYFVDGSGHYSPAGNHFFAFAIRQSILDWLEPKPITYRNDDQAGIDFKGYLKY